jgi:hypothetical protein
MIPTPTPSADGVLKALQIGTWLGTHDLYLAGGFLAAVIAWKALRYRRRSPEHHGKHSWWPWSYSRTQTRRWRRDAAPIFKAGPDGSRPHVTGAHRIPAGHTLTLSLPNGLHAGDMAKSAERIASALHVGAVHAEHVATDASKAKLHIIERDPFAKVLESPLMEASADAAKPLRFRDPLPVAMNIMGEVVSLKMLRNNLLVGGQPGAGKSVAMNQVVAAAALDPTVDLWLFDGKLVELSRWKGCAARFVGIDLQDAIKALVQIKAIMMSRYDKMEKMGGLQLSPPSMRPLVLVIDELSCYLVGEDRAALSTIVGLLRSIVSLGRAAGVIVIAATQRPSHDIVPTSLRNLFSYRWALRCDTPTASDIVLGEGWAGRGANAATIDPASKGEGYLLYEEDFPVRCRSFNLPRESLGTLVRKAEAGRVVGNRLVAVSTDPPEKRVDEGDATGSTEPQKAANGSEASGMGVNGDKSSVAGMVEDVDVDEGSRAVQGTLEGTVDPFAKLLGGLEPRDLRILAALAAGPMTPAEMLTAEFSPSGRTRVEAMLKRLGTRGLLGDRVRRANGGLTGAALPWEYTLSPLGRAALAWISDHQQEAKV